VKEWCVRLSRKKKRPVFAGRFFFCFDYEWLVDAAYADGLVGCPALDDMAVAVDALVAIGVFRVTVAALDEVAGVDQTTDIAVAWLMASVASIVSAIGISAAAAGAVVTVGIMTAATLSKVDGNATPAG
jgi:hypothetical protein